MTQMRVSDTNGGSIYTHGIHGAGIYTNIGGIFMVNVTIYSIHGSYGYRFPFPDLILRTDPSYFARTATLLGFPNSRR